MEFAHLFNITDEALKASAKAFAMYSGESYPLAARAPLPPALWLQLFRIARSLIRQVNSKQTFIDHWIFGGGTAMMLQIHHRES
jgi:hypothetical protein